MKKKKNKNNIVTEIKKNKECNHNPNDGETTLKRFPHKNMVYPQEYFFVCPCCHKGFSFLKDENGKFVLKEQT